MMVTQSQVCPILSVRNPNMDELCLEGECALYLPNAKKCSLLFLGYKAMLEVQKAQMAKPAASQPPSS